MSDFLMPARPCHSDGADIFYPENLHNTEFPDDLLLTTDYRLMTTDYRLTYRPLI
jgi:hypothetical protein